MEREVPPRGRRGAVRAAGLELVPLWTDAHGDFASALAVREDVGQLTIDVLLRTPCEGRLSRDEPGRKES